MDQCAVAACAAGGVLRHAIFGFLILSFFVATVACAGAAGDLNAAIGGNYGLEADMEGQSKPAGFDVSIGPWYRYRYHNDASPLWDGLYVQGGGVLSLNPAYGQLGVYLEWLPVAILQLRAQVDRFSYFGHDGSLLSYSSSSEPYGESDLKRRRGQEISGTASRLMLQPTLRGEYGRFVVENQVSYAFYRFNQYAPYFWDQEYDTLLKQHDRLFVNDLFMLYDFAPADRNERLLVGPGFELVHALGADLTRKRVGLSCYFEPLPRKSIFGGISHPRYYFQAGVNVRDPNHQGQFYLVGGVGMDLDLD